VNFVSETLADTCDLIPFVDEFKQQTAYEFSKTRATRLWQRRYYDHILRPNETIEDVACYIWWNPIRKQLCTNPNEYPLSGSQTLTRMKQSANAPQWHPP